MNNANVLVFKDGTLEKNILITGKDYQDTGAKAEVVFRKLVAEYNESICKRTPSEEDMSVWLDDGCAELPTATVFLSWPDTEGETQK